jgi:segregation and condensation protein A
MRQADVAARGFARLPCYSPFGSCCCFGWSARARPAGSCLRRKQFSLALYPLTLIAKGSFRDRIFNPADLDLSGQATILVQAPPSAQGPDAGESEYRVRLDVFHGPLDLLLFLVRRDEIDVLDIPIAAITDQYLRHLEELAAIDLDRAGDFLVLASTLIAIKSRMMLPRADGEDGEQDDPRAELIEQLLEYRKFKDASSLLRERARHWEKHYPRLEDAKPAAKADPESEPIQPLELWDLVSAFDRLMRETLAAAPATVIYDETPLETHMRRIQARLEECERIRFLDLFEGPLHRSRIVGVFLALLELVRLALVRVEQVGDFGEIWIRLRQAQPAEEPRSEAATLP